MIYNRFNDNHSKISNLRPQLFPVRVIDIILDDKHEDFEKLGKWNSIGTIKYKILKTSANENISNNLPLAIPLFPNNKNYPLKNEIVYILSGPSIDSQNQERNEIIYYISPINIWNNSHHNALPDIISNIDNEKDYQKIEHGFINSSENSQQFSLGKTFNEQEYISPLLPFEGDYIIEGRFGNSIRFGSTVNNSNIKNTWSEDGDNGNPILIIRNTKFENKDYTIEDINKDSSSIYLTENQKIPVDTQKHSQKSFNNENYTIPSQYNKKQIILSSGRLVFNAYDEDILLFSNNSIGLSSLNNFNVDVKNNTVLNSSKIYLGLDSTEPLLLGNKTIDLLRSVFKDLNKVANNLSALTSLPPGTPYINVNIASKELSLTIQNAISKLDSLKSKQNYTL
jgi:hypothetical protein